MAKPHSEEAFESAIVTSLAEKGGYELIHPDDYDRERAFLPKQVLGHVQDLSVISNDTSVAPNRGATRLMHGALLDAEM
jgi:hypothetical protein